MPVTRAWAIVRSLAELDTAAARLGGSALFLATNGGVLEYGLRKSYACVLLHEKELGPEQVAINRWAAEMFLEWTSRCTDETARFFADKYFLNIRQILIRALKYRRVLEKILEREKPQQAAVFDGPESLLGLVLKSALAQHCPGATAVFWERPSRRPVPTTLKDVGAILAGFAANVYSSAALLVARWRGKEFVLASGSLVHLEGVLDALSRDKRLCLVYAENRFNLERFRYGFRRGILLKTFPERRGLDNALKDRSAKPAGFKWSYQGQDLSGLIEDIFKNLSSIGFLANGFEDAPVRRFFESYRPSRVVLDEDFSIRRLFYLEARRSNIPCTVISHGIPGILVRETGDPPVFCEASATLVHSDFEKWVYERMGYRPENLRVTGTPRYDRLRDLKRPGSVSPQSRSVLFCTTLFEFYDFTCTSAMANFLGHSLWSDYLLEALKDLLEILKDRPEIRVRVKPHYREGEAIRQWLAESGFEDRCEVLSHREDMFALEAGADLILTPVSSVICEAILLDKPVIIVDYGDDPAAGPYARDGVAWRARNRQELERAVRAALFSEEERERLFQARRAAGSRFSGVMDGRATERVVSEIRRRAAR